MHRLLLVLALAACSRPPAASPAAAAAAPQRPRVDAPGEVLGAYRIQDRPASARLLAERPHDRAWTDDGWSAWWDDGVLWVHRVTCGRCRAIQGWTYVVALDDPDGWRDRVRWE